MHEAVFKDGFDDGRGALGDGIQRHELRLHVGGESGERRGADADSAWAPALYKPDMVVAARDFRACRFEFFEDGFEQVGAGVARGDVAAGNGGRDEMGAGFDTVRQGSVARRFEGAYAFDGEGGGADAADFRSHGVQAVGEVADFGLAGGVAEDGGAFGECGGHEQVFGARDGHHVHEEAAAAQFAAGFDVAFVDVDMGTEGLHAFDVLIHGAGTDGTTAGQGDASLSETGKQRSQHENAGAHGFDELVRRFGVGDVAGIHRDLVVAGEGGFGTHGVQDFDEGVHVAQARHVINDGFASDEQGGSENGQDGVLGAANGDFAVQRFAAAYFQLFHQATSVFRATAWISLLPRMSPRAFMTRRCCSRRLLPAKPAERTWAL